MFVFNAVGINKIVNCLFVKTDNCAVNLRVIFIRSLHDCQITAEHFKTNIPALQTNANQSYDCKCTAVSACNLFSVWLLYKSICLLILLFSAITSKLQAWFSWNFNSHSFNTADNAWKNKKDWNMCEQSWFSLRGSQMLSWFWCYIFGQEILNLHDPYMLYYCIVW